MLRKNLSVTDDYPRPLTSPPTTKELQRHFGLSRKEAVRFHKEFNAVQYALVDSTAKWNDMTGTVCASIKSLRKSGQRPFQEQGSGPLKQERKKKMQAAANDVMTAKVVAANDWFSRAAGR